MRYAAHATNNGQPTARLTLLQTASRAQQRQRRRGDSHLHLSASFFRMLSLSCTTSLCRATCSWSDARSFCGTDRIEAHCAENLGDCPTMTEEIASYKTAYWAQYGGAQKYVADDPTACTACFAEHATELDCTEAEVEQFCSFSVGFETVDSEIATDWRKSVVEAALPAESQNAVWRRCWSSSPSSSTKQFHDACDTHEETIVLASVDLDEGSTISGGNTFHPYGAYTLWSEGRIIFGGFAQRSWDVGDDCRRCYEESGMCTLITTDSCQFERSPVKDAMNNFIFSLYSGVSDTQQGLVNPDVDSSRNPPGIVFGTMANNPGCDVSTEAGCTRADGSPGHPHYQQLRDPARFPMFGNDLDFGRGPEGESSFFFGRDASCDAQGSSYQGYPYQVCATGDDTHSYLQWQDTNMEVWYRVSADAVRCGTSDEFDTVSAEVDAACCSSDAPTQVCSAGVPETCTPQCAAVLLPAELGCTTGTGFLLQPQMTGARAALVRAAAMCRTDCSQSTSPFPYSCTASDQFDTYNQHVISSCCDDPRAACVKGIPTKCVKGQCASAILALNGICGVLEGSFLGAAPAKQSAYSRVAAKCCSERGNATSVNVCDPTSWACQCPSGWSGEYCELFDPCNGLQCGLNGECAVTSLDVAVCQCDDGYSGDHCEIDPCHGKDCGESRVRGRCVIQGSAGICECGASINGGKPYGGEHCEIDTEVCCSYCVGGQMPDPGQTDTSIDTAGNLAGNSVQFAVPSTNTRRGVAYCGGYCDGNACGLCDSGYCSFWSDDSDNCDSGCCCHCDWTC